MPRLVKRLKEYDHIEFDSDAILRTMARLKGKRRKPTSIALEEDTVSELKQIAETKGVPYQVLMRLFIIQGLKRLKRAA